MKQTLQRWTWLGCLLLIVGGAWPAHAFYNPTTGRWLNRDPMGERGGNNLYGFVHNTPVQRADALGLRPIPFSFNAFINGKKRALWHDEPPFSGGLRQFSADDRDFGEFDSSKRNARVFSIGTIESKLIGTAANGGASGESQTGFSERRVRRFPSVFDLIGFGHGSDTAWDYERRRAPLSGGNPQVEDLGPCKTKVSVNAGAAYPFGPYGFDSLSGLTPNINYDVTFTFEVTAKNQVTVTLTGSHNSFPDYEGYADGNNFYKYSSSWAGPNPFNLGMTWRNIPSGTKHVINNIEVPDCCPASSKYP